MNIHNKKFEKFLTIYNIAKKHNCKIFFETGTHDGYTFVHALMSGQFEKLITIELNSYFHQISQDYISDAYRKFGFNSQNHKVFCIEGDSSKVMQTIIENINIDPELKLTEKTLFWLDAHYDNNPIQSIPDSGECPIIQEIKAIQVHKDKNHIILVDDVETFYKNKNYPDLDIVKEEIIKINENYLFSIENNVLICEV